MLGLEGVICIPVRGPRQGPFLASRADAAVPSLPHAASEARGATQKPAKKPRMGSQKHWWCARPAEENWERLGGLGDPAGGALHHPQDPESHATRRPRHPKARAPQGQVKRNKFDAFNAFNAVNACVLPPLLRSTCQFSGTCM